MNIENNDFLKSLPGGYSIIPYHRFLSLNQDCFDTKTGCIHFDMRDEFVGNIDFEILHGGVIASILDIEGAFLLALDGAWRPKAGSTTNTRKVKGGTIDMRIDYLRPGNGKHFVASGTILRHGKKVAVVRSELRNERDELIAAGTATYLIS